MLRQNDLLDLSSVQNKAVKNRIIEKIKLRFIDGKYEYRYYTEFMEIIADCGWNELHSVIQSSLKNNYRFFLCGKNITERRLNELNDGIGFFLTSNVGNDHLRFKPFYKFSCYHLLTLLSLYALYIIFHLCKSKLSIVSLTFMIYVLLNVFTLYLTAPADYDRLIMPSLTVILIIIMQTADRLISIVKRKPKAFELQ